MQKKKVHMPFLNLEELLHLGNQVVTKTLDALVIGSGNVESDLLRTSSWSSDALRSLREKVSWNKLDYKEEGVKWIKTFYYKDSYPLFARDAAQAMEMRAGNCYEMSCVAAYFISEFFSSNPDAAATLATGKVKVSFCRLPEPYDHVFIRMELTTVPRQIVYVDPWMPVAGKRGVVTSDYNHYVEVIRDLLKKEQLARLARQHAMEYWLHLKSFQVTLNLIVDQFQILTDNEAKKQVIKVRKKAHRLLNKIFSRNINVSHALNLVAKREKIDALFELTQEHIAILSLNYKITNRLETFVNNIKLIKVKFIKDNLKQSERYFSTDFKKKMRLTNFKLKLSFHLKKIS